MCVHQGATDCVEIKKRRKVVFSKTAYAQRGSPTSLPSPSSMISYCDVAETRSYFASTATQRVTKNIFPASKYVFAKLHQVQERRKFKITLKVQLCCSCIVNQVERKEQWIFSVPL
jgi:hypothetical protein